MIQFKQPNIFDYYAPTGGVAKIADFSSKNFNADSIIKTAAPEYNSNASNATSNSSNNTYLPDNPKVDNTWVYLIGGVILIGIGYLVYKNWEEENNKDRK